MKYLARIYRHEGDFSAEVPDLPGCVAGADSVEACRRLITEALALHIDLMRRGGERVPKPSARLSPTPDASELEAYCTWIDVPDLTPQAKRAMNGRSRAGIR